MRTLKYRLTPVKKVVNDLKRGTYVTTKWINTDKNKNKMSIGEFFDEFKNIAEDIVTDKQVSEFVNIVAKKYVPDIKSVSFDNIDCSGLYSPDHHIILLNKELMPEYKKLILMGIGKLDIDFSDKASINFTKESSEKVGNFVRYGLVLFHETIHAMKGDVPLTKAFEEGSTELLSLLLGKQFLKSATNNKFELSNFLDSSVSESDFMFGLALTMRYGPFMHRVTTLGKYLDIQPGEYTEALIDFKIRDKDSVKNEHSSFVAFLGYLKKKFPSNTKLKDIKESDIELINKQRIEKFGFNIKEITVGEESTSMIGYLPDEGYMVSNNTIRIAQLLDSSIPGKELDWMSLKVKLNKQDPLGAVYTLYTYFPDFPRRWLPKDFTNIFEGDGFKDTVSYMREMFKYVHQKYNSIKEFQR